MSNKENIPDELDPMNQLEKATQKVIVRLDTRSYGKEVTIVEPENEDVELKELASNLKSKLACGGTVKDGQIELQGDHLRRIKEVLKEEGFDENKIEIK